MGKGKSPRTHLSVERDGRLVESLLLWVPDIRRDDGVEWQTMVVLLQFLPVHLSLDSELATNSILHVLDRRVKLVNVKSPHVRRRVKSAMSGGGGGRREEGDGWTRRGF